jgi:hypothetical protein
LQYVNELSCHLDAARVLREAFGQWQRLFEQPLDVPDELVSLGGVWLAERIKHAQKAKEEESARLLAERLAQQALAEQQEAERRARRASIHVHTGKLVEGDWMTLDVD